MSYLIRLCRPVHVSNKQRPYEAYNEATLVIDGLIQIYKRPGKCATVNRHIMCDSASTITV